MWDTLYIHVVCLYPINVKTAELIEPIFGNSHEPGKKYGLLKVKILPENFGSFIFQTRFTEISGKI